MLAHNVYFKLKDQSDEARAKLIAACKTHLTNHPGVLFFACGLRAEELTRPVNDRDFDVALHLVFDSVASHDTYQDAPGITSSSTRTATAGRWCACSIRWSKVRRAGAARRPKSAGCTRPPRSPHATAERRAWLLTAPIRAE